MITLARSKKVAETVASVSLTQGLIALIRGKPVTEADLATAALFTLDAVANALAGRNSVPGRALLAWAKGRSMDAGRRALVMGGLTHILEVDDLHRASVVHPGCVVVPAVFALSEERNIGGTEALTAVLHGFEAASRVGMAVGTAHYKIWHNTATCGPYGSAMAAATLLGLSDREAMHALGNAGTQSAGLWQFLATGAMSKHLHAGRAAEAGVVAAELAKEGFTGPPAILEGPQGFFMGACPNPEPGAVLAHPEGRWQVHETSVKPWPSCRHTHPVIDAALALHRNVDPARIDKIEAVTYQAALDVCNRPEPKSEYEAKFSLQHCVAVALIEGKVGFGSFDAKARDAMASFARGIAVRAGEPFAAAYPGAWGGEVRVVMKDGARLAEARRHCKGDPEAALGRDAMIAKARELLAFGGVKDADGLIRAVLAMAEGGPVTKLVI